MKKEYYEVELEIIEFKVKNVLTDSDPSGEGEGGEI